MNCRFRISIAISWRFPFVSFLSLHAFHVSYNANFSLFVLIAFCNPSSGFNALYLVLYLLIGRFCLSPWNTTRISFSRFIACWLLSTDDELMTYSTDHIWLWYRKFQNYFCRGHATYKPPCRSVRLSVGRSVRHTLLFSHFWAF